MDPLTLEIRCRDGSYIPIPENVREAFRPVELTTQFMLACDLGISGLEYPVRVPGVGVIRVRASKPLPAIESAI